MNLKVLNKKRKANSSNPGRYSIVPVNYNVCLQFLTFVFERKFVKAFDSYGLKEISLMALTVTKYSLGS